jgi:hypothetical protein
MGWVVNVLPRERPGTHYIEGWVSLTASLDRCEKYRSHRNSNPRTVQLVPSRYTDCAIPAHHF